jgi:hypothetical protein
VVKDFLLVKWLGTESPYADIDAVGAVLLTGTWTADATDIDFLFDGIIGSMPNRNDNAILNGFVVQEIPEPMTLVLLGLGCLTLRRKRK